MNCEYHVGLLVYGGHGAALRVRPDTPVPIDQFPVWFESRIDSQGVADHTSITPSSPLPNFLVAYSESSRQSRK